MPIFYSCFIIGAYFENEVSSIIDVLVLSHLQLYVLYVHVQDWVFVNASVIHETETEAVANKLHIHDVHLLLILDHDTCLFRTLSQRLLPLLLSQGLEVLSLHLKEFPVNVNVGVCCGPLALEPCRLSLLWLFRLLKIVEEFHCALFNGLKEVDLSEPNFDLKRFNVDARVNVGMQSTILDHIVVSNADATGLKHFLNGSLQEVISSMKTVFPAVF